MELEGATRAFNFISSAGVGMKIFISDCHKGIAKWMRTKQPIIKHFFTFGMIKKVLPRSNEADKRKRFRNCR
jgi:hypothetical protein